MINGRYRTRSGEIVVVHDNVGHTVVQQEETGTIITAKVGESQGLYYDDMGNCDAPTSGYDLVERLNPQSVIGQMKVEGCELCKNG